jgi:hypothetical protein
MTDELVSQGVKINPGPISPAPKINPENKPKPTALLTSHSELRNDLMWIDFECDGFDRLVEYNPRNEFAVTLGGYQGLCDRSYDDLLG